MTQDKLNDQRRLDASFAGGLAWTAGAKSATQIFSWISVLVIARILAPGDYGIGEIAGIFVALTNVLAEFGLGTAVLHMPELERRTLGQLHLFSMFLSSGISIFAVIAAPAMAWFFHSPHVGFFAATSIGFLITGIQAVPFGLLQRDMDYRRLALVEALSALAQSVVGVVLAILGFGYWALFWGGFSSKLVGAVVVCYWKPVPFAWPRWADIARPVRMGRQLAIGRIASAVYNSADGIIVGRVMGEASLGTYRMAMNLAAAPSEKISSLIMRTASPLFANVMNDAALVRRYYLIIAELMSLAIAPTMLGLSIVAPEVVRLLMGPKWSAAAGPLRWLCLFMVVRVLGVLAEQVLVSQLQTRFTMRMSILGFFVMPIAFFSAGKWAGPTGVAAAWVAMAPITIVPLLVLGLRRIKMPWLQYANALWPAVAGSIVMCAVLWGIRSWHGMDAWPLAVRLAVEIVLSGGVYGAVILLFFREKVLRYVNFLQNLRSAKQPESVTVPE